MRKYVYSQLDVQCPFIAINCVYDQKPKDSILKIRCFAY